MLVLEFSAGDLEGAGWVAKTSGDLGFTIAAAAVEGGGGGCKLAVWYEVA